MNHPRRIAVAAVGFAAWALSLYLIATTSNLIFLASSVVAAGVALPASWWAIRNLPPPSPEAPSPDEGEGPNP